MYIWHTRQWSGVSLNKLQITCALNSDVYSVLGHFVVLWLYAVARFCHLLNIPSSSDAQSVAHIQLSFVSLQKLLLQLCLVRQSVL